MFWTLAVFAQGGLAEARPFLSIQILYDNYVFKSGCKAEWGYACLVQTAARSLLFDTGRVPRILRQNMAQLRVDPGQIDTIVISHNHADHSGGLIDLLRMKPDTTIYLPASTPGGMVQPLQEAGASVFLEKAPVNIAPRMWLSGEMQSAQGIIEQALFIQTGRGLVVLTGCAHPGIVAIVHRAKTVLNQSIDLVAGGFHLQNLTSAEVREVIRQLQKLGVARVGPSHCTGDRAIALFREAYGDNFIQMGVGQKLTWEE